LIDEFFWDSLITENKELNMLFFYLYSHLHTRLASFGDLNVSK